MFGDKLIIGHSIGKICDKGRIFIPSFAYAEGHDQVILEKVLFEETCALKIYAYQEYLNIINRFQRLRENTTSYEEHQKYTKEIEKIALSLHSVIQIDTQKRILLPSQLLEDLQWNIHEQLQYDGLGESLLVRKLLQNK